MKLSEGPHSCWGGTFSLCSHSGVLYTSINKLNKLIGLAGLGQNCFFGLSSMPYLVLVDVCSHLSWASSWQALHIEQEALSELGWTRLSQERASMLQLGSCPIKFFTFLSCVLQM